MTPPTHTLAVAPIDGIALMKTRKKKEGKKKCEGLRERDKHTEIHTYLGSDGAGALVAAEARAGAVVDAEVLGGGEARGAEAAHEAAAVVARAVVGGHDAVAGDEGLAARGARRGWGC